MGAARKIEESEERVPASVLIRCFTACVYLRVPVRFQDLEQELNSDGYGSLSIQ